MIKGHTLFSVFVLCFIARSLLADPLFVPSMANAKQAPKYTMTYDNRIIMFSLIRNGVGKLFQVDLTWYGESDARALKTADLSLEVLDQAGKVIPTTPESTGFTLIGSMGGGDASMTYKIALEAAQVPTSVNVTWRGKQQHIVLNADNYLKL